MELARGLCLGEGESDTYTVKMTETFRFDEEIRSLMRETSINHNGIECSPPADASVNNSFTALLGLPSTQAVELLHEPELGSSTSIVTPRPGFSPSDNNALNLPLRWSPTLPSNATLVERAARFSFFASAEDSADGCSVIPLNSPGNSPKLKSEPVDSDYASPIKKPYRTGKRKEAEQPSKARSPVKKIKTAASDDDCVSPAKPGGDKLPYVHVRARRGQATDSHSLAERARREKINARMKLLQELVPGCSKISGTALVLDEIINHVQSLQRRVEFLSMRLATVNPRIDFTGFDNLLSAEQNHLLEHQKLIYHVDMRQSQQQRHEETPVWGKDQTQQHHVFISSSSGSPRGTSFFSYDSVAFELPLSNKLKSET